MDGSLNIFPQLWLWRIQHNSDWGCKAEAANDFLMNILPYLSGVVVRAGAFFVHDFPDHDLSLRLRPALPSNFEQWTVSA